MYSFNTRALVLARFVAPLFFLLPGAAGQQQDQADSAQPPAAPAVVQPAQLPHEDKRLLGVLPNYRTVPSRDRSIPPLTAKQKFTIATKDSFDPPGYGLAAFYAGLNQWTDQYHSWGQGVKGFAKRYAGGFADQAISNYLTEGALPALLHEDPRYFRSHTGSAWRRAGYAATRVLVIRTDSGKDTFNFSEILGTAGAVGISNLYYPADDRSFKQNAGKFVFQVGTDAGFNVFKEFWPEIKHKLFRHKEDAISQ